MTPTCVHQRKAEFNADCVFCREAQQLEGEAANNSADQLPKHYFQDISSEVMGEVMDEMIETRPEPTWEEIENWASLESWLTGA
jgi:hypothetical protein